MLGVQSENLIYEWNDVALLTDQRAYTFVCKTMLQIPTEELGELQTMSLVDWQIDMGNDAEGNMQINGWMQLQIESFYHGEMREPLHLKLPLQGKLRQPLGRIGDAKLLYYHKIVEENHLFLETALQISRELELQRGQVMVGPFAMDELLRLPDGWPDCDQVVLTAVDAVVNTCLITGQRLHLEGMYQLLLLYADEGQSGERLFLYKQVRPFIQELSIPDGLQELTGLQPYYQNLSVQLWDARTIQIMGDGVLCTVFDTSDFDASERAQCYFEPDMEESKETEQQEAETEEVCGDCCPVQAKEPPIPQSHPSVVNSRGSCRANLEKHMRDLHGFVQSPTSMRNFEIGVDFSAEET